ncbi:hypothetical protein ES703_44275 [subsurface metagenome]
MKKVILNKPEDSEIILLSHVGFNVPIFLIQDGIVRGLVVEEKDGWIVSLGGKMNSAGFHETREAAINRTRAICPDSEFYIDLKYDKS